MEADWELVVYNSDSELVNPPNSVSSANSVWSSEKIGEMIKSDHFSLDATAIVDSGGGVDFVVESQGSVESGNPSFVDLGVGEGKYGDFDAKEDVGFLRGEKREVGFEGIGGGGDKAANFDSVEVRNRIGVEDDGKSKVGFEELGEIDSLEGTVDLVSLRSDSSSDDAVRIASAIFANEAYSSVVEAEERKLDVVGHHRGGEVEKKTVAWWKVPLELLKHCVFKASPVWSFAMAAAVMGFIILARRLYRMKQQRKLHSLQLKLAVDDKKASQVMSNAARLNKEAFSVARLVPLWPLPGGVSPWPMMTLR